MTHQMKTIKTGKYSHLAGAYFSYILLFFLVLPLKLGGPTYFAAGAFLFLLVPLLDALAGKDRNQFSPESFSPVEKLLLRFAPIGYVLGYIIIFFLYTRHFDSLRIIEQIGAILSMGAAGTITVTACHELVHKSDWVSRTSARMGFMLVGFMHFEIFHPVIHHKEVGTKKDINTAWINESAFTYVSRTVPDAIKYSFNYEKKRLTEMGHQYISYQYRMLWFIGFPILITILLSLLVSPSASLLYILQAFIAVFCHDVVNYIQHYGLLRKQNKDGSFERVQDHHSWDSYHKFSNYILFMLQRHAAHHKKATKQYYYLGANNKSPQLPFGYPMMIVLAMIPPLWRAVQNPGVWESLGPDFQSLKSCSSKT
ncbi:MAG: alkane 1-monooxygenase, partial [Nitrospinales bacterium]